MIRRLFVAVTVAMVNLLVVASSAGAQYPPSPTDGPTVLGETVAPPGGADPAFTGSGDVVRNLVIVGALLVLGVVLLALSRRRAVRHGQ